MTPREVTDTIFAALNRPGVREPRQFQRHNGSVIRGQPLGVGGWEAGMFVLIADSTTGQPVKVLLADIENIEEICSAAGDDGMLAGR
jgi:hypothetical protein